MEWVKILNSKEEARNRLASGKPQLVIIGEKRICLVLKDDLMLAVSDTCTHSGESLSKGIVNYIGEIVCPWHGYRFNLRTGRCAEDAQDLATYPVKESEEGVFIGL